MRVALSILEALHEHHARTSVEDLRLKVRVGISANRDNVIVDINGHPNVSGAAINESQRVMSEADGGQILVGEPVFNLLRQHDEYALAFKHYPAVEVKHRPIRIMALLDTGASATVINPQVALTCGPELQVWKANCAAIFGHFHQMPLLDLLFASA